jgi:hypothetical protein
MNAIVSCYCCRKEHKTKYNSPPPNGWFKVQYSDDTYGLYCSVECFLDHADSSGAKIYRKILDSIKCPICESSCKSENS